MQQEVLRDGPIQARANLEKRLKRSTPPSDAAGPPAEGTRERSLDGEPLHAKLRTL